MTPLLVVLDTNILLLLADLNFSLEAEIERLLPQKHQITVITACVEELEHLKRKSKIKANKLALAQLFLKKENITISPYNPEGIRTADEKIIAFAQEHQNNCVVVTNDIPLKKKLLESMIPVIFIRGQQHFELLGQVH